jgi:hypothetical protein
MQDGIEIDTRQIGILLSRLNREMGDNGKFKKRTLAAFRKAGNVAVRRAGGYLPYSENMPRGFAYVNQSGNPPKANSRNKRKDQRPWPRYDRDKAVKSIKVASLRANDRRVRGYGVVSTWSGVVVSMKDPAGSIFDTAGKGKDEKSESGLRLIHGFNASSTVPSNHYRVLLPAVIDTRPEIIAAINVAIHAAERALQTREVW